MKIPSLILGTFQYHSVSELLPIIKVAYSTGIIGYDTSPSYQTENMLGQALQELYKCNCIKRENVFIQDKIDGWQMESTKGNVAPFVDESLNKLKTDYIDVLFIHWPFPEYLFQTLHSSFFHNPADKSSEFRSAVCKIPLPGTSSLLRLW